MARLSDFRSYLDDRRDVLAEVEKRLCTLQSKYESYFTEVAKVRETELGQLVEHTLTERSSLTDWFNQEIDRIQPLVEAELDDKMKRLETEANAAAAKAEHERRASMKAEQRVRDLNVSLDREEEALKDRTARLLARVAEFNARIKDLGRGFGFFVNLFSMRRIHREKSKLQDEHDDLAARIETFRARWQRKEGEHSAVEEQHRASWLLRENEAATLRAKIEALEQTRPTMVVRTTVERVLESRRRDPDGSDEAGIPCARCGVANPPDCHFCHICVFRLGEDRLDFFGSVDEIAEVNGHFERFGEGMKACQELIGLVRGLHSGVEAFIESVADVQASEEKYPLPKLKIDVPESSRAFGSNFDDLHELVSRDLTVHPKVFAGATTELVEGVLTEEGIKGFFETMGEELSRQADSQWK